MKLLSVTEYAAMVGVSDSRIRRLFRENRLYPSRKIGKRIILTSITKIIRPWERSGRGLRKIEIGEFASETGDDMVREIRELRRDPTLSNPRNGGIDD